MRDSNRVGTITNSGNEVAPLILGVHNSLLAGIVGRPYCNPMLVDCDRNTIKLISGGAHGRSLKFLVPKQRALVFHVVYSCEKLVTNQNDHQACYIYTVLSLNCENNKYPLSYTSIVIFTTFYTRPPQPVKRLTRGVKAIKKALVSKGI